MTILNAKNYVFLILTFLSASIKHFWQPKQFVDCPSNLTSLNDATGNKWW